MAGRAGKTYETPAYLAEPPQWFFTSINQTSTILSLLTPEYRQRTVQMHYHQAVTNAPLWPGTFCWPDGFMRLFSRQAHLAMDFVTTPERVQLMASSAENFIRHFNVGRTFNMSGAVPRLGADVPRWFGESVAFWDGDTLITWTSNVDPVDHARRVRVFATDADGRDLFAAPRPRAASSPGSSTRSCSTTPKRWRSRCGSFRCTSRRARSLRSILSSMGAASRPSSPSTAGQHR